MMSCGNDSVTNAVLNEVVVEIGARGKAENEVGYLRLRVFDDVPDISYTVVPVIATNKFLELERIAGERCVNSADSLRGIDPEGFAITASTDLEFISASHGVVVDRVQRVKNPHAAIRLGMQYEQVSIRFRSDIYLHAVTQLNTIPV